MLQIPKTEVLPYVLGVRGAWGQRGMDKEGRFHRENGPAMVISCSGENENSCPIGSGKGEEVRWEIGLGY